MTRKWMDMTDCEKGAILLAHHRGETILFRNSEGSLWQAIDEPLFAPHSAYRVKPKPKVEHFSFHRGDTNGLYQFSYSLFDGEADVNTICMRKVE